MNECYFRLFLKAKMGIFLNYGGARSHHGGAGRITPACTLLVFGFFWSFITSVKNISLTLLPLLFF